jgi:hypothetical protein
MQGDDVQSDDVWRWRPDAVSSEEPRTVSSLDPRGGGEALMARQVGRRSYRAKAAVRRDELGGASMQPSTATPSGKFLCHPWSLVVVELFSSPILSPREFTFYPFFLHIRNYLKVCPNLLNLLNAGDSFAGISSLTSCYLFSRTRDLIATF